MTSIFYAGLALDGDQTLDVNMATAVLRIDLR